MKTLCVVLALLSVPVLAQAPEDLAGARAADAPVVVAAPSLVPAAPVLLEDGPILFEADGKTAKHGRPTVVLKAGQPAPFPGRLIDAQEQTHREQINERNAAELKDLQQGNMILPTAAFWGILGGVALAASTGTALAILRPWEHKPQP